MMSCIQTPRHWHRWQVTFHTICLIVSTSKSRTVSNSFFANIKQLFKLKYGSFLSVHHDYFIFFTYWLELTKLITDEINVREAFLYRSFKIMLSKTSEDILFRNVFKDMLYHLAEDWWQSWEQEQEPWMLSPKAEFVDLELWSPCSRLLEIRRTHLEMVMNDDDQEGH